MSSALPRHPDSFLGPCEAWIRSIKHCANRPPDSSSTPFRIWIPTEVQLDLLVTSKFDFLGERTKVCSERHFPAALGPETKKEGEWVWQEASPGSFVFPPRYANQPASPDNSHLLGKDRESTPPLQHFGKPLTSGNLSFHTVSAQCKVCLEETMA